MTTTSKPDAGQTRHAPSPRKSALGALLGGKPWDAAANRDNGQPAVSREIQTDVDDAATVVVDAPAKVAVDFMPPPASTKVGASTGGDNGKVHIAPSPQVENHGRDSQPTGVAAQPSAFEGSNGQASPPEENPKRGFVEGMLAGLRQKRRLGKRAEQKASVPQPVTKVSVDVAVPVSEDTVNFTTKHEYRRKHLQGLADSVALESIPADDEDESCDTNTSYTASADTTPFLERDEDTRKIQHGQGAPHNADTRPLGIVTGGRDYVHDADTESVSIVGTGIDTGTAAEASNVPAVDSLPAVDTPADNDKDAGASESPIDADAGFETASALPTVDVDEEHTTVMSLPHVADLDAEETCVYVPLVSGPVAQARGAVKLELADGSSQEDDYWPQSSGYSATDTTSQFKQASDGVDCSLGTDTTSQTTTDRFVEGAGELASAKPAPRSQLPVAEDDIFPVAAPRAAAVGSTPRLAALEEATDAPDESADKVSAVEDSSDPRADDASQSQPDVESSETDQDTAKTELLSSVQSLSSATSDTSETDEKPVFTPVAQPSVSTDPVVSSEALASVDAELATPDEPVNRIGERLDVEADELTEDTSALPMVGHAAILASRDRTVGAPWLPYKKLQKAPVFAPTRVMTGEDESWHDQVAALAHRFPNAYVASYWEADPEDTTLPSEQALVVVRPESVADVLHAYPLLRVAAVESVTFADSCQLSFEITRILGRDKGARWQITSMDAYTGAVHGTVYIPTGKVFNEAHRLRVLNEYRKRRQHRWPTATQDISFSINLVRTPRKATA